MLYRISFSIITAKMLFLNNLLISLYYKSVNKASCTRTNISVYRDCLADIPVELANMSAELTNIFIKLADMPIEVIQFSITGFSFAGYFQGHPQPRFIVGSIGSVSSLRAFKADRGASSLFNLTFASSSPGLTSWVSSGQKYNFTKVLLKLIGLLESYIQHISFSTASKRQGPVQLPLSRHTRTLELSKRSYTRVILSPLQQYRALLTVYLAYSLTISAIAFCIAAARSVMDGAGESSLFILRQAPQTRRVGTSPFRPAVLLTAFTAIYRASSF